MCGIAGFWLREGTASQAMLQGMCDLIRHRGPDDQGFRVSGGCAIGMRRLSIIDLATGHQPIGNEDGSLWVVFNGEIYDYKHLRQELISDGHRFSTQTDTETIVHLYEKMGVECFRRLHGMFGLCLWDERAKKLVLARDRFGKKPLYYAIRPEGIYFASELKCLRLAPIPFELNEDALRLYFQFTYVPDPHTPFRGIHKLLPGTWLEYSADGSVRQGSFWQLPQPVEQPPPGLTEEQAMRQVRDCFDRSVARRMIADVPLGAFLSGGIDSSSVVASMALQSDAPIKTFSIGFEESAFNELPYAKMVAERYRTDHHEILVRPDAVSLMERIVRHFDEPFADSSAIPTFIVSEFAVGHVKVALSGDGGDELFDGYESTLAVDRLRSYDGIPQSLRKLIGWTASRLPYAAYGKNYLRMVSRPTPLERYFEYNYSHYFLRERLLTKRWAPAPDLAFLRQMLPHCLLPDGSADIVTQVAYFEAAANLTGDMLVKVDRMSMATSLEVRCPLLDTEIAELAARLPHSWKMRNGRGKHILREALKERLPEPLLTRGKMGFGVPLADWYRGSLRELLHDHLLSRQFLDRGIVSREFVEILLREHASGRRNNNTWLTMLLMLEMWFRAFSVAVPR